MIRRILSGIEKIGGAARRIIIAGLASALMLLCAAVVLRAQRNISYAETVLSRQMCETSVTLFAEGMVFGLWMDFLLHR